jgi:chromosome segregation ATPase
VIELGIKNQLTAFVVANKEDLAVMQKILNKHYRGRSPRIFVQRKPEQRHIVRSAGARNALNLLDGLIIEDPWAYNVIVDQVRPESLLMMEDKVEANQAIRMKDCGAKMIYLLDGDAVTIKGTSVSYMPRMGGGNLSNKFLYHDFDELVAQNKGHLAQIVAQLNDIDGQRSAKTKGTNAKRNEVKKLSQEIKKVLRQVSEQDDQMQQLKSQDFEKSSNDEIAMTETELKRYENELQDILASISEQDAKVQALTEKERTAKEADADKEEALNEVDAISNKLAADLDRLINGGLHKLDGAIKALETKLRSAEGQQKDREIELKDATGQVKVYTDLAVSSCPVRPKLEHTLEYYTKEYKAIEKRIQVAERQLGQSSEIAQKVQDRYMEAKIEFGKMEKCNELVQGNLKRLEAEIKQRQKSFGEFRKQTASTVKSQFNQNLAKQGHAGRVKFDWKNGTLDLDVRMNAQEAEAEMSQNPSRPKSKVLPPSGKKAKNGKSAQEKTHSANKMNSGGENSYTTLAFVLALGEAMQSPFRAMDEFDVFMDSANRRISMNLLVQTAESHLNRQFIFITPQDVSNLAVSRNIKIQKIAPPDRNQTIIQ